MYITLSQPNYQATKINMFGMDLSPDIYRQQSVSFSKLSNSIIIKEIY